MLMAMGVGIPFRLSAIAGAINPLNTSEFYAPLTHSLILTRGTGDPTYSRGTNAWEFDNEGKLILVPGPGVNCARFGGARMVRNRVATTSATLASGATNTVTLTNAETVTFSMGAGTGRATFSGTAGATGTLDASTGRVQVTKTCTAGTFIVTASVATLVDIQVEVVTGQSDQTASEYVSVGVLSAPFHGAGIDGVKYFSTNKDGSAISPASLLGYHAEGARTNSLLYSRDLRNIGTSTAARTPWVPGYLTTELVTNGTFATDTNWTKGTGWTITGGVAVATSVSDFTLNQNIGLVANKTYFISFDLTRTAGALSFVGFGGVTGGVGGNRLTIVGTTDGTYSGYITVPATSNGILYFYPSSFTGTIDNVSVKEAAIQVTTCTGIDNAANSASTLTAGSANATILQTLTLASAVRSSSAYVKRRTGTGTISFTRNGGTAWTDITSLINSSTWTRVKIENTSVTDPSIGFLIATSGDAIDVDVVQDEAGARITSPIITTTTAVTRNADADAYQTASNWSDTQGWMRAEIYQADWSVATGGIIGSATNGLLPLTTNTGAKAFDGTNTVNGPTGTPSGSVKMAATWGSGALQVAANGTAGTAGSYDGAWNLTTIGIGASADNDYIKNVYIGTTAALTAAQLAQVTS